MYNSSKKNHYMIDFTNETTHTFDLGSVETLYHSLTSKDIELLLVDNTAIQAINKETRSIDAPTDVLSFPIEPFPGNTLLGTIVISSDKVEEMAKKLRHTFQEELQLLFIHGMLHLLGFDHEVDQGEMRSEEERIIREFDLPQSLIIRTEH